MPLLVGTRRALLGSKGIKWLLNDSFNDTLTAGNVNGTPAVPGPGTRAVVDRMKMQHWQLGKHQAIAIVVLEITPT